MLSKRPQGEIPLIAEHSHSYFSLFSSDVLLLELASCESYLSLGIFRVRFRCLRFKYGNSLEGRVGEWNC